jgi:hypothetical protein
MKSDGKVTNNNQQSQVTHENLDIEVDNESQ